MRRANSWSEQEGEGRRYQVDSESPYYFCSLGTIARESGNPRGQDRSPPACMGSCHFPSAIAEQPRNAGRLRLDSGKLQNEVDSTLHGMD